MDNASAYAVDWSVPEGEAPITHYVNLLVNSQSLGLYQVRHQMGNRLVLAQQQGRLPVGLLVEVYDVQGLLPHLPTALQAEVVSSDQWSACLAW